MDSKARRFLEIYDVVDIDSIDWTAKPTSWAEVDNRPITYITKSQASRLKTLYYNSEGIGPMKANDIIPFKHPDLFIYVLYNKKYLINTEGYDYPRYVTRVNVR